jgi:hypothetical protein
VGGGERIGKRAVHRGEAEMPDLTHVAVAEQLLKKLSALHPVRRRTEHRNQVRPGLGGGKHFAPLA